MEPCTKTEESGNSQDTLLRKPACAPASGRQPGSKSREGLLQLAQHHELPVMLSQPTGQYWPAQQWGNLEQQIVLTAIRYEAPQEALENPTDGRKKNPKLCSRL